jgi:hypothetical protein
MHLIPSNRTGETSLWNSTEPSYDDFFTLWDLFRCSTPLWQVLQPKPYEEIIRSLIDIWRHEGFRPDARSSQFTGRTQGGSNAEDVLADAHVKGVRGDVNWEDVFEAMKERSLPWHTMACPWRQEQFVVILYIAVDRAHAVVVIDRAAMRNLVICQAVPGDHLSACVAEGSDVGIPGSDN